MTARISWTIEQIECKKEENGLKNVVYIVSWRSTASYNGIQSTVYGTETIDYNDSNGFIDYNDLKEDIVVGWVKESIGPEAVAQIEEKLNSEIQSEINNNIEAVPLPWI